ncbi:hypothetical protein ABZ714_08790 [Streptomyces sp. NPDC006798]|uniref:hypothetical protein n=1 Tax=Streptomyces sp. NPDC006798 TaxID=3155462 RepID=UPI0033C4E9D4
MSSIIPSPIIGPPRVRTLASQSRPVHLLAGLLATWPGLPAAQLTFSAAVPDSLTISLHHTGIRAFEAWRAALGLPAPVVHSRHGLWWLSSSGVAQDCPVNLVVHEDEATVRGYQAPPAGSHEAGSGGGS